ncbi:MAG: hypothetical protein OXC46_09310 [Thaumarchaeota archaeon]|nr:hypothetical protein [Nitrososphaerota archaeon]
MAYRQEYEISIPSKDLPNKTSEEEEYVSRARHQPAEPPSLDIKTSNGEEYMFREFFELRQQLNEYRITWLTAENFNGIPIGMAIGVARLILVNAQFNIENIEIGGKQFPDATIHFTSDRVHIVAKQVSIYKDGQFQPEQKNSHWKPKASFIQVFPKMSNLIKNILDITKDTSITEERKDRVYDNITDLIDLTHNKVVDFNKFKPDKDKARWQYRFLMKSLDTST